MNRFPLYESIKNISSDKELSLENKNELLKNIKKLDATGYRYVYCLIACYYMETTQEDQFPKNMYSSKDTRTGIKFDLKQIPVLLQNIIYNFLQRHIQRQKEEIDKEKIKNNIKGIKKTKQKI